MVQLHLAQTNCSLKSQTNKQIPLMLLYMCPDTVFIMQELYMAKRLAESYRHFTDGWKPIDTGISMPYTLVSIYGMVNWIGCYDNSLWFQRLLFQLCKVNTSAQF